MLALLTEINQNKWYFFRLKGVQPVLRLTTKDGAIFQNSDPISLTFAENSAIASTVLEWIMPPLASRYMETCALTKTSKLRALSLIGVDINGIGCYYLQMLTHISKHKLS